MKKWPINQYLLFDSVECGDGFSLCGVFVGGGALIGCCEKVRGQLRVT